MLICRFFSLHNNVGANLSKSIDETEFVSREPTNLLSFDGRGMR